MEVTMAQLVEGLKCEEPDAMIYVTPINMTLRKYAIDTPVKTASFLAQVSYETMRLSTMEENLNHTDVQLANTWPARYAAKNLDGSYKKINVIGRQKLAPNELANSLHRNPKMIANVTYAGRLGNGPESSGDGWKYRGRGGLMTTGKDNYVRAGKALDLDLINNPDILVTPIYAMLSAGAFWWRNSLNFKAENISVVTRIVSGSYHTFQKRKNIYDHMLQVLNRGD